MKMPKIKWVKEGSNYCAKTSNRLTILKIREGEKVYVCPNINIGIYDEDLIVCKNLKEAKKITLERIRKFFEEMEEEDEF